MYLFVHATLVKLMEMDSSDKNNYNMAIKKI